MKSYPRIHKSIRTKYKEVKSRRFDNGSKKEQCFIQYVEKHFYKNLYGIEMEVILSKGKLKKALDLIPN